MATAGLSYNQTTTMILKRYRYTTLHVVAAIALSVLGVALITTALLLPPQGYIDPTVLAAFGELLTFCAALAGMDYRNGRIIQERKD